MLEIVFNEKKYPKSVFDGDKKFVFVAHDDYYTDVECSFAEIKHYFQEGFPECIMFTISEKDYPFLDGKPVGIIEIRKRDNEILLNGYCYFNENYNNSKWSYKTIYDEVLQQIKYIDNLCIEDSDEYLDERDPSIGFRANYSIDYTIEESIKMFVQSIEDLFSQTEISLGTFKWRVEYEKDEARFCNDVITPLLRRMGFLSVKYNHGINECGKDYTFSELTPFGDLRFYGLQVKAGNIDGGVNSRIDEIIGQVDDAFSMPFFDLNSKQPIYISTFIIMISGKFTTNAKQKIISKIPKGIIGAVYFFDKEGIIELIEKYWYR